jgi:hypothetical protein
MYDVHIIRKVKDQMVLNSPLYLNKLKADICPKQQSHEEAVW